MYVVTNWHCLSGRNPQTGEPIGTFFPNKITVEFRFSRQIEEMERCFFLQNSEHEIDIEDEDGNWLWLQHPKGALVDLAAVRLPILENGGWEFYCLNQIEYEKRWRPEVSSEAFIVGFPEGLSSSNSTPIWKRASIASEPDLDHDNNPVILMDTVGNSGLSGSPVIAKGSGMFFPDLELSGDSVVGSWKRFLGVYAGRLGKEGIRSQLGRVWKAHLVDEIFQHQDGEEA